MPIAPEAKSSKSGRLASQWVGYPRRTGRAGLHSVEGHPGKPMADENATNTQCGGKKKAMLAYGIVQISATVVSAISLAAIAVGLCSIKQESKAFNGCVEEIVSSGKSTAEAVRYCNGG